MEKIFPLSTAVKDEQVIYCSLNLIFWPQHVCVPSHILPHKLDTHINNEGDKTKFTPPLDICVLLFLTAIMSWVVFFKSLLFDMKDKLLLCGRGAEGEEGASPLEL